jgi:hypothetical protein
VSEAESCRRLLFLIFPSVNPVKNVTMALGGAVTINSSPLSGLDEKIRKKPSPQVLRLIVFSPGLETLPSLYGTKERRSRTKVTGAGSGFIAGGKGLAFGFYDGISGLVLDPWEGAKKYCQIDRRSSQPFGKTSTALMEESA